MKLRGSEFNQNHNKDRSEISSFFQCLVYKISFHGIVLRQEHNNLCQCFQQLSVMDFLLMSR